MQPYWLLALHQPSYPVRADAGQWDLQASIAPEIRIFPSKRDGVNEDRIFTRQSALRPKSLTIPTVATTVF